MLDVKTLLKKDKKKLSGYIMQCLDILDEAYSPLYGVSPINEKQKKREMDTIYQVLIPELAAVILKDDKVVAYGFMMPSINEVMQKGRGHIIPFGFIPYLKAMKKVEVADMMSIGITKEHKNKGAAAMIMYNCLVGLNKLGVKYLETGPMLEDNMHIQNLWKSFNPELAKRRRCWGLKVNGVENDNG